MLHLLVLLQRGLGGAGVITFVTGMSDPVVLMLDMLRHGLGHGEYIFPPRRPIETIFLCLEIF